MGVVKVKYEREKKERAEEGDPEKEPGRFSSLTGGGEGKKSAIVGGKNVKESGARRVGGRRGKIVRGKKNSVQEGRKLKTPRNKGKEKTQRGGTKNCLGGKRRESVGQVGCKFARGCGKQVGTENRGGGSMG